MTGLSVPDHIAACQWCATTGTQGATYNHKDGGNQMARHPYDEWLADGGTVGQAATIRQMQNELAAARKERDLISRTLESVLATLKLLADHVAPEGGER